MVTSANLSLGLHLDIKQRCSSSEKHELYESHPSTAAIYSLLVANCDSSLSYSQHYCASPAIATLSSSWSSISYLEEEGFLHSQPRLGTHPCLSHNPADPVLRAANRSGKEASLQTTLLHRKEATVLCQLVLHHLF